METPPLGSSCPSCASLQLHQLECSFSAMDVEDSNASQSAGRVASGASSSAWAPHRGKCYHPSGNTACTFTSAKHCAIGTMERVFRKQNVRWVFCHDAEIEKDIDTMLEWQSAGTPGVTMADLQKSGDLDSEGWEIHINREGEKKIKKIMRWFVWKLSPSRCSGCMEFLEGAKLMENPFGFCDVCFNASKV